MDDNSSLQVNFGKAVRQLRKERGGEAALASMVTGFTAITYNPAAVSDATIKELKNANLSTDTSRILQYIISGEPVNFINDY